MRRFVAAVCLAVAPAVALAVIYKAQMPDGTILYTDAPPPGGKILDRIEGFIPPDQLAARLAHQHGADPVHSPLSPTA